MTNEELYKVSQNIKEIRKINNETLAEMAKKMKVSKAAVGNWESGAALPTGQNIYDFCKIYNVTPNWLYNYEVEAGKKTCEEKLIDLKVDIVNALKKSERKED